MRIAKLLDEVFLQARIKGISMAQLAERAGIRPETLSRLKRRQDANVSTVHNLALAAGFRLTLVALDESKGDAAYSAAEHAQAKAAARRRDEALVAAGRESRASVHRRNAFMSFPATEIEIKGVDGSKSRSAR